VTLGLGEPFTQTLIVAVYFALRRGRVSGLTRSGIVSRRPLRDHRRHAIVALVALALLLPGTDVVTTFLELIPMLALYELSVFVAGLFERSSCRTAARSIGRPGSRPRTGKRRRANRTRHPSDNSKLTVGYHYAS
jgi:hypothetical protein